MPESLRESILSHGLIAICRRIYGDSLLNLAEALYKGGVRQMEVTFDQVDPDGVRHTSEAIEALCKRFPEMDFGAGTVLTTDQVDAAQQAGGTFIVSPNTGAYSASKGGVTQFTKWAALEMAKYGIRVCAFGPGTHATRLTEGTRLNPERCEMFLQNIPMGRFGEPDEATSVALFLGSDEASYCTGQTWIEDGGNCLF